MRRKAKVSMGEARKTDRQERRAWEIKLVSWWVPVISVPRKAKAGRLELYEKASQDGSAVSTCCHLRT